MKSFSRRVANLIGMFGVLLVLTHCGKSEDQQTPGAAAAAAQPATLQGYWYDQDQPERYWVIGEKQVIFNSEYKRESGILNPRPVNYERLDNRLVLKRASRGWVQKWELQIEALTPAQLVLQSRTREIHLIRMPAENVATVFGPDAVAGPETVLSHYTKPAPPVVAARP